ETSIVWKWVEVIAALLAGVGLFFSGTRGSMIGLLAGLFVAGIAYMLVLKDSPKTRQVLGAVFAVLVVVSGIFYMVRDSRLIKDIPALDRLLHTSLSEVTGGSARSIAWKIAFESWKDRPVFGWGPNNFFY